MLFRLVFLGLAALLGCSLPVRLQAAPNKAIAGGIATDSLANVYVAGSSLGASTGLDFAIVKYNASGVQQWVARYNGPGNGDDVPYAIATDTASNVYVTGSSLGLSSGLDFVTIKYNSSGVRQWVARYNGPANSEDIAYALAVDSSGNVYVTGSSTGAGSGLDYATVKYNASGVQQWVARYNGPANSEDIASALTIDGSGNVYVTGSSMGLGTQHDYATVKYNGSGVQQWVMRYNGPASGDDIARAIVFDGVANIYVTGSSLGAGTALDYATVKYGTDGTQRWVARYDGPANMNDIAYALAVDVGGNAFVTGSSTGLGTGLDYATVKYDPNGNQLWVGRYNGPPSMDDTAYAIVLDSSSNVYVTGGTLGTGTMLDYATVKYNSSGTLQWTMRYNGPASGDDVANDIALSSTGNVYVTGSSLGSATALDFATIRYNSSNGALQWVTRFNGAANGDDIASTISIFRQRLLALWPLVATYP